MVFGVVMFFIVSVFTLLFPIALNCSEEVRGLSLSEWLAEAPKYQKFPPEELSLSHFFTKCAPALPSIRNRAPIAHPSINTKKLVTQFATQYKLQPLCWDFKKELKKAQDKKWDSKEIEEFKNNKEDYRLHLAASHGNLAAVEAFVRQYKREKLSIDTKTKWGSTPLMYAAQGGHEHVVVYLLEQASNVHEINGNKKTALHFAAESGNLETTKKLVKAGAQINALDNRLETPIMKAQNYAQMDYLFSQGTLCGFINVKGHSLLHILAFNNNLKTREELTFIDKIIEREKLNIDLKSLKNNTALDIAVDRENLPFVKKILQYHPKLPNILDDQIVPFPYNSNAKKAYEPKDPTEASPIEEAIAKELILYGGFKHAKPLIFPKTLPQIHRHILFKHYNAFEEDILDPKLLHTPDQDGNTPLIYAAVSGNAFLFDYLLKSNASFMYVNISEKRASQYVHRILGRTDLSNEERKKYTFIYKNLYARACAMQHVLNRIKINMDELPEEIKEHIKSFC